MLNSQINHQNPRIRSNTTDITKRKQEARNPGGEDRETRRSESTGERTAGYLSTATRHVLLDHCSSTITMLLTTVLLLLCSRSSSLLFFFSVILHNSLCIFLQVEPNFPIFGNVDPIIVVLNPSFD